MGILPDITAGIGMGYSMMGEKVSVFALSYAVRAPLITGSTGRFGRFGMLMLLAAVFLLSDVVTLVP